MTYNANTPNASQSPAVFPAQANTNFARLRTIINADHVFNNTAAATDGIHKQVTLRSRSTPGSLPAGNGILYSQTFDGASEVFWYNGITNRKVSGPAIYAAVNFDGTGLIGTDMAIRSSYTVDRVLKLTTGNYRVYFKPGQLPPNADYLVSITGMRNTNNSVCYGCVRGSEAYGDMVKQTYVEITFNGDGSNNQDVLMGNVIIYQIT